MHPSGQLCSACGSSSMILKAWNCPSSLWQCAKTETDELLGSRGHLAASIQPDQRFTLFFLCPLTKRRPLKHQAVKVRGHTNRPIPSSLFYTVSSISVHHTLSCVLYLPPLSLTPHFWHFGLLIWLEERSLVDPCCYSFQTHRWIAAGNHFKYTLVETKALCSTGDAGSIF